MKKLVLSLAAAFLFVGVSAQKAEMEAVKNAYKNKNYSEALDNAKLAESKLETNATIEPESIAELYYTAAKAAKESGDLVQAGLYYSKLGELENNSYYKTKNKNTKDWEYYYSNEDADNATKKGKYSKVKVDKITNSLLSSEIQNLNKEASEAFNIGNEAFNSKNYAKAADEFLKAYYLYKALGEDKLVFKYYAALGFVQSEQYEKAADIFQSLIDDGFTGVETNYIATNADGKDVSFSAQKDMDTQVQLGLVSNPRTEETESLEEDLFSNATYTYYQLKNYDKALEVGEKGLKKYPENKNMNNLVTGSYSQNGNSDKFIEALQSKVDDGTASENDYFNLAKSLEDKDAVANHDLAKAYYLKAIELNPNFEEANLNLAFLIITPEKEYVELMNTNLGASAKEKSIYNKNKKLRLGLYEEAIPYLEKAYEQNPENTSLIKILSNAYEVVGNDDKYDEFKAKYEALR